MWRYFQDNKIDDEWAIKIGQDLYNLINLTSLMLDV